MKIIRQSLAFDVDSEELKVCFQVLLEENFTVKTKGSRTFKNTLAGFKNIREWTEKKRVADLPVHLVMEATGVYYENAAYFFNAETDYKVHVVLGNVSNAYFKSLNLKSKTDKIDAKALSQLGLERELPVWEPITSQMHTIKKLVRERLRLSKEKTMVSNQLHAEKSSYSSSTNVISRYKSRILFIKKQIKEVEKELKKEVKEDKKLNAKIENICEARGLGFITVIGVIAEYNGFILFKNRSQVVSYAGYDVVSKESGTSIKGKRKISKRGNSKVRKMMYMAAMSSAVHDEHNRNYYNRIVNKTGLKMKANVAIQRKLLLLIYTLFKSGERYDPFHYLEVQERLKPKKEIELGKVA